MKKLLFVFLFFGFLGAGFYYGSQDDTYVHKFFLKSKERFPANEAAKVFQNIWNDGDMEKIKGSDLIGKSYSPLSNPDQTVCEFYQDVVSLSIYMLAESSISDSAVRMTVKIDCDERGAAPIFLKSFCSEKVSYFREVHTVENSTFSFENILDGFPKSWYIDSADITRRDGLSVIGVKPSQDDVKAFGKYSIECSSL